MKVGNSDICEVATCLPAAHTTLLKAIGICKPITPKLAHEQSRLQYPKGLSV